MPFFHSSPHAGSLLETKYSQCSASPLAETQRQLISPVEKEMPVGFERSGHFKRRATSFKSPVSKPGRSDALLAHALAELKKEEVVDDCTTFGTFIEPIS
jgi:hypothetical protein